MKIGIVVATKVEKNAFFEVFGEPNFSQIGKIFDVSMWYFGINRQMYLITSGVGEIAAAMSTQYLIDKHDVDVVLNYGVAGSLTEEHSAKKVGIVKQVVHYDFDITCGSHYSIGEYPGEGRFLEPIGSSLSDTLLKRVKLDEFVCASADKIVAGGEPKRMLREEYGADICEMEAAGILRTCNRNSKPCIMIKAISDGVDEDSEAFDKYVDEASLNCVKVIAAIIKKTA